MLTRLFTICCLFLYSSFFAQDIVYDTYDWEEKPSYEVKDNTKDMLALKEKIVSEYLFEDEVFVEYLIEHRVLWLNADDAIEDYNKVYLPLEGQSALIGSKARVINKSGDIIELDESKILSASDEETGRTYKYFAFEGIEKGSFIEYYYIVKKSPSIYGKRLYFQYTYDKYNIEFDLYSPQNLEFQFKNYNGLPEVELVEGTEERNHWSFRQDYLKGLDREDGAPYDASRAFLVYKIHKNNYNNKVITSYASVAQDLFSFYFKTYEKRTEKDLDEFIEDAGITSEMSDDEKIRKLDFYIKKNFYLSEAGNESLEDVNSILSNKAANDKGLVKLYVAALRKLDIKHEMVLTSDRFDLKFDDEFEANNFLQEFLIYFPGTKKYLAPDNLGTFYGFPPPRLTDNFGLFIKQVKVGNYTSAVAKIKYIKPLLAKDSKDIMLINVSFDEEDMAKTKINLKREMTGYYGMYIHPFIDLIPEDDKDEALNSLAKNIDENAEVEERTIQNENSELFGVKPLIIDYKILSESFVEKAGNKYLFKLGNLIGPQVEMYQEKERKLDYQNDFNRSYLRTITIELPEGYRISNADDINISNTYKDEKGDEIYSFQSFYEMDENKLVVTANEHYRENIVPVDLFEEFRKIINSAADFNKITLIIEPK